jgi:hypothetical protein
MKDSAFRGLADGPSRGASPATLVQLSVALLVFNILLIVTRAIWTFMPDDRALYIAIVYAIGCAWCRWQHLRRHTSGRMVGLEARPPRQWRLLQTRTGGKIGRREQAGLALPGREV